MIHRSDPLTKTQGANERLSDDQITKEKPSQIPEEDARRSRSKGRLASLDSGGGIQGGEWRPCARSFVIRSFPCRR
jgi:hypothetical protein